MAQDSKRKKKDTEEKPREKKRELQDPAFDMKESEIMSGVRMSASEAIFGRKQQ